MSRSVRFDDAAAAPSSSRTTRGASLAGTMLEYFTAKNRGETTQETKSTSTKYPALDPTSVDFEEQVERARIGRRMSGGV